MWVLDFLQGRLHSMCPHDVENTFIKAADSETKEGLWIKTQDHSSGSEPRQSGLGPLERKSHRQEK